MVVDISFMKGRESRNLLNRTMDRFVRRAGLEERFAVIQDTYVEGEVDMVFDEGLWRRLVAYVAQYDLQATVTVTEKNPYKDQIPLDDYLRHWEQGERDGPPPFVVARKGETVVLAMVTEYWNTTGGPYPYHDSYTYSLFSDRDLSADVPRFLSEAAEASRWKMAERMFTPDDTEKLPSPIWSWIWPGLAALVLFALFHAVGGK